MPTIITRAAASVKGFGFAGLIPVLPGQQAYTTAGTYSWVAPAGVTKVSVVAVGGGAGYQSNQYDAPCAPGFNNGGGGGGLGWKNNYTVTPGSSYTVFVGSRGPVSQCEGSPSRANGQTSYFVSTSVVYGGGGTYTSGGSYNGDGGGTGGSSPYSPDSNGGGGAGGYSGAGGAGGTGGSQTGKAGAGGGGGGGGYNRGPGGGVGILGEGSSGAAVPAGTAGNAGSGGLNSVHGGGAGNNLGGVGAVRIIWAGTGAPRAFPSTNTGDL